MSILTTIKKLIKSRQSPSPGKLFITSTGRRVPGFPKDPLPDGAKTGDITKRVPCLCGGEIQQKVLNNAIPGVIRLTSIRCTHCGERAMAHRWAPSDTAVVPLLAAVLQGCEATVSMDDYMKVRGLLVGAYTDDKDNIRIFFEEPGNPTSGAVLEETE